MAEIDGLLKLMTEKGSSDLHVKAGSPPAIRLNGRLVVLREYQPLDADATRVLAMGMMDDRQKATFENHREVDFAYSVSGVGRFRVNVFHQRGAWASRFGASPPTVRPCRTGLAPHRHQARR
jgi:twitching motility protein PilT